MYVSIAVNMAPLLQEFSIGTKNTEASTKICAAFCDSTISAQPVQIWFQTFVISNEYVEERYRSSRSESLDFVLLKVANENDWFETCQDLSKWFSVSDETIYAYLYRFGQMCGDERIGSLDLSPISRFWHLNISFMFLPRNENCPNPNSKMQRKMIDI